MPQTTAPEKEKPEENRCRCIKISPEFILFPLMIFEKLKN